MFLNSIFASLFGGSMLMVFATLMHAKSLSSADGPRDVQQTAIDLRHNIHNTVKQTAQESYDESSELETLIRGTLRKLIQQNPDVVGIVPGHDILESSDLESDDSENQQEETRQKRSPSLYKLGGGWSLRRYGAQNGRGRWTVPGNMHMMGRRW